MEKLEPYIDKVIETFSGEKDYVLNAFSRGELTKEEFLDEVKEYIQSLKLPEDIQKQVLARYTDYLWAYDILEPLIQAEDITDIHCVSWNCIRIKQIVGGRAVRVTSGISFESAKHFRRFVEHLVIRNKVNLSNQNAQQHFVDKLSNPKFRLRCSITANFLTCNEEPFLYIRKEPKEKKNLAQLFTEGMFTEKQMRAVREAAQGAVIVSGESGSGKSALINAMLEEISMEQNVLILQADDELFAVKHPDVVALHTVERRKEDGISYTFHDLGKNAMLMDRDYIIFSEVKGLEARDAFTAALTGHHPWLSLHAPSNRAAMYQFANYVKAAADFSVEDIFKMLAYTPFTLIHLTDFKVDEITRMTGWDEETRKIRFEDVSPMEGRT